MENNIFYVYKHIREDKNEVFYIGMGRGKRAYDKWGRNKYWKNIVNNTSYKIEIIQDNLTKKEAEEKEIEYIKIYGRKDLNEGTLVNMTDGGDGGPVCFGSDNAFYGKKHTKETCEKMSNTRKTHIGEKNNFYGKKHTEETKKLIAEKRIGKYSDENNGFYGKSHSKESREKMSISGAKKDMSRFHKKVAQINVDTWEIIKVWNSLAEAAEKILGNKKDGTYISAVCKGKKKLAGGFFWKYI